MTTTDNTMERFIKEVRILWQAENMLTEAMPLMMQRASHLGLRKNLAMHLAETDQHKEALRAICKQLGYDHEGETNDEMKALLADGDRQMQVAVSDRKIDAAIITAAIKVEHYEIERYEAVAAKAEALGYDGIAKRLRLTLEEERQADTKLNFLEKNYIVESSVLGAPGLALK